MVEASIFLRLGAVGGWRWGARGEHLCQYRFSIWGCAWSSFVSILSVSWSILVEVLEDIGVMAGGGVGEG